MADMTRIKGRIAETIYPNGTGAITAESHQALLLEMVDDINTKKADQSELIATQESLDALEQKVDNLPQGGGDFNAEGNYPLLHVGTADDLAGRGESVPAEFGFRASGGKSIKDGRAYIKRIKGNSVVWNQLVKPFQNADIKPSISGITYHGNDITIVNFGEHRPFRFNVSFTKTIGHQYLLLLDYANTSVDQKILIQKGSSISWQYNIGNIVRFFTNGETGTGSYEEYLSIYVPTATEGSITLSNLNLYDLTQMFGAGNEPTTIEDFYARVATLGVDMNAYNEGQVIHCNTESIKSVGDNAWDEEWRNGLYASSTGEYVYRAKIMCNANAFRILPNEEYWVNVNTEVYFFCYDEDMQFIKYLYAYKPSKILTPANAAYMNFYCSDAYGSTYKNDILISLYHSGWKAQKDDQYQPYWQDTLPLPIIRKYFPNGMKSAGTAHDEIYYDKTTNKKFAVQRMKAVKMKDLNWSINENNIFGADINDMYIAKDNAERKEGILSARYGISEKPNVSAEMSDKSILRASRIYLRDTTYSDSASFKASLTDEDILYYELAEPIVTELDAEDQNFRDYYNVADFGTEMSQSSVPSAPFSADIIYQFNAVDMIREHEAEITELQNVIATMQAQLTSLINGGQ